MINGKELLSDTFVYFNFAVFRTRKLYSLWWSTLSDFWWNNSTFPRQL